jgi:hypothetical protein
MNAVSREIKDFISSCVELEIPDSALFLLQIAAWKKLSTEGKLPERLSWGSFMSSKLTAESFAYAAENLSHGFPEAFDFPRLPPRDAAIASLVSRAGALSFTLDEFYEALPSMRPGHPFGRQLPDEALAFIAEACGMREGESLYIPYPGNYHAARFFASIRRLEVSAEDPRHSSLPGILFALEGRKIRVSFTDPLESPGFRASDSDPADPPYALEKFDRSFVDLVSFSGKSLPCSASSYRERFIASDPDKLKPASILEHAVAVSRNTLIAAVPHNFTFRTVGLEKRLKERFLGRGELNAVVALPKNMLPYSIDPFDLVFLGPSEKVPAGGEGKVYFLNLSRASRRHGRKNGIREAKKYSETFSRKEKIDGIAGFVEYERIGRRHFNLLPSLYPLSEKDRLIERSLSAYETMALSEIAEIRRSSSILAASERWPGETAGGRIFREVRVVDIPEHGYVLCASEEKRAADPQALGRNLLAPGDILLSVKGNVGWAGLMPSVLSETLAANQVFLVLRIKPETRYEPIVLLMYLKSDLGQSLLRRIAARNKVSTLQAKDVMNLPIPMFGAEKVLGIRKAFEEEERLYASLSILRAKIDELRRDLC